MSFICTKLDRRHSGFGIWTYSVKCKPSISRELSLELFHNYRAWCWDTWGPSKELTAFSNVLELNNKNCNNSHWCWLSDQFRRYIYLREDSDMSLFSLRWYE